MTMQLGMSQEAFEKVRGERNDAIDAFNNLSKSSRAERDRLTAEIEGWRVATRGMDAEIQRLRVMASVEIKPVQMSAVLRRKLIKQVESPYLRQLMGLPPKVIPK
jgi:hypothetical protein